MLARQVFFYLSHLASPLLGVSRGGGGGGGSKPDTITLKEPRLAGSVISQ